MDAAEMNPLISAQKSSDSGLQISLHPLVLLTISDYITRHTLRQQTGPIVGALLGQQHGREITIEHAFECLTETPNEGGELVLDATWFAARLDQMKLVHKDPELDLVGWYTLLPHTGPTPELLPIHHQILSNYNESAVLLAFHPEDVLDQSAGGKLPFTIYESNYEVDDTNNKDGAAPHQQQQAEGEDREMKDGGATSAILKLKFRELPYTVETGEAEMISMDYVAGGAGNAAATGMHKEIATEAAAEADPKGKGKIAGKQGKIPAEQAVLSREDDEFISTLTAKVNAIKMLHGRIQLITKYLEQLPPSYLEEGGKDDSIMTQTETGTHSTPSHAVLRSIQAIVGRLALLDLSADAAFERELLSQTNDVHLVSLLDNLMQSVSEAREIGKRFAVVEAARSHRSRTGGDHHHSGGGAGSSATAGGGGLPSTGAILA